MNPYSPKPKSRYAIYIILLVAVIVLMYLIKTCSRPTGGGRIENGSGGDTIDVGIEYGVMTLYMNDDTLGGFSYDLLRYIANKGGLTLKFHPLTSITSALDGLESGKFDIIVGCIPATSSIADQYGTTQPIFLDRQLLVQRKDSLGNREVNDQLDLGGKTVYISQNSPVGDRIRALGSEIGDTIYIVEEPDYGNEQLVIMVANGDIDYAAVNARTASKMIEYYDNIDISTAVSFNQFQSWLLNKKDSLLLWKLDSLITITKDEKYYQELKKRYGE